MKPSLIEKSQLSNFPHMSRSTIYFDPHDNILLVASWSKVMTSKYSYYK